MYIVVTSKKGAVCSAKQMHSVCHYVHLVIIHIAMTRVLWAQSVRITLTLIVSHPQYA